MKNVKVRLLALLAVVAMLLAVSGPAIADHDGFDDDNGAIHPSATHPSGWDDNADDGDDGWGDDEEEGEEFAESEEFSDWCTDLWWELSLLGVDPWTIWQILDWWDCN